MNERLHNTIFVIHWCSQINNAKWKDKV